uniref:Uncharacterized protein n=1 Tax=Triticum urartu TaxID=4572 RepID=A0A8R7R832_TRIUA
LERAVAAVGRYAQRLHPVSRGPQRRVDGLEQPPRLLQRHAGERGVPVRERAGAAVPRPGELGLLLAQLRLHVAPLRVPRAGLRRDGAPVPLEHSLLRLPHERRSPGAGRADERDRDRAERGELRRLLLQPLGPPGVGLGARPRLLDEPHGDLAAGHRGCRPAVRVLCFFLCSSDRTRLAWLGWLDGALRRSGRYI